MISKMYKEMYDREPSIHPSFSRTFKIKITPQKIYDYKRINLGRDEQKLTIKKLIKHGVEKGDYFNIEYDNTEERSYLYIYNKRIETQEECNLRVNYETKFINKYLEYCKNKNITPKSR